MVIFLIAPPLPPLKRCAPTTRGDRQSASKLSRWTTLSVEDTSQNENPLSISLFLCLPLLLPFEILPNRLILHFVFIYICLQEPIQFNGSLRYYKLVAQLVPLLPDLLWIVALLFTGKVVGLLFLLSSAKP